MGVRQIFTAVGTVVGAFFGAPQLGALIGSALGNAIDPQVVKGPSVGDIATQTSQEGGPRPIIFGLSPPIAGNIIVSGPPRKVKKKTSQGKGGPKVVTESVFRTYAIGICEGPITQVVRVWRNAELVYDARDAADLNYDNPAGLSIFQVIARVLANNAVFTERAQFFLGTYDQLPPAELEEILGVGETPAHRGTAYMLVVDDDVTDQRGAIPQFMFQVERCEGYFLTSRPYAIEDIEPLAVSAAARDTDYPMTVEALEIGTTLLFANLGAVVFFYSGDPEAIDVSATLGSGAFKDVVIDYTDGDPEAIDVSATLGSGEIKDVLIEYEDGDAEAIDVSATLQSGVFP